MPSKPLNQSQQQDAQRLKKLFELRKQQDPALNQERLAQRCGWKTQGAVNQYLNGKIPLNLKALQKFAAALNFSIEQVSPDLAQEARNFAELTNKLTTADGDKFPVSKISAFHPDDAPADNVVYVAESQISFSAGSGKVANYELIEDQEPASYRLSWFQKYGINPAKVRRFRVAGDSMEPLLFHRDTILVNTEETNIIDNKLYAIRYGEQLRVKYLIKKLDGSLILRSVNPHYPDEHVPAELVAEHISIIGRVRDKSGTGGL